MKLNDHETALMDGLHGALEQAWLYAAELRSELHMEATAHDINGVYSDLSEEIEEMEERLKAYKERLEEL